MKIAISAESTCDLNKEFLTKYDVKVIPFEIVLGDKTFKDGDISIFELFENAQKTGVLPKTNAINQFEYVEYFTELKKDYDAVIHICLSGGITSTVNNAYAAQKEVEGVYVVDSKSLSCGIGLLAIYARELADSGLSPEEIYQKVSDKVKSVSTSFVVERLDYLYKGGRCSGFQLLGANLLKIRPRISMVDGKMVSDKKYRGDMVSVGAKYTKDLLLENANPDLDKVFIAHTSKNQAILDSIKEVLLERGFKNIYFALAGTTIASHCGENTIGVIFFSD